MRGCNMCEKNREKKVGLMLDVKQKMSLVLSSITNR